MGIKEGGGAETVESIGKEKGNGEYINHVEEVAGKEELAWSPLINEINQSIKNTSSRLMESFRQQTVTDEDVLYIQRYTTVYLE